MYKINNGARAAKNTEILLFTKLTYGKYNVIKCPNVCYKIGSEIGRYNANSRKKTSSKMEYDTREQKEY